MRRFSFLAIAILFAIPSFASADSLGQTVTFRSNTDYDADDAEHFTASLQAISDKAYFYVDHRYWDTLSYVQREEYRSALQELGRVFDGTVYPKLTGFWGPEYTPGVDGDPRVTIAVEKLKSGVGGYFMSLNSYSTSLVQGYNAREMFYVTTEGLTTTRGRDFLAHEFQHLISQYYKNILREIEDDVWLNEARSEYSITVAGYSQPFQGSNLQRRTQSFLRDPGNSLVQWDGEAGDYAVISMFTHYLADRYGSDIIRSTIDTPQNGVEAINAWLSSNGRSERFPEVFADWAIASFLNDRSVDPRYGYVLDGLNQVRVSANTTSTVTESSTVASNYSIQEWEPTWTTYYLSGSSRPYFQIQLSPQASTWYCAAVARYGSVNRVQYCSGSTLGIPTSQDGTALSEVTFITFHGSQRAIGNNDATTAAVSVTASFATEAIQTPALPMTTELRDGDLIRHNNEPEVYVIWGIYRRYLPHGVLELYGFQNRPVYSVDDATFNRFTTSNYVRAVDTEPVYALWPDGTKHWLDITPVQWDASGRDWNAIFIVNPAEANFYTTGSPITR
ncbi:MAG TPA: hypothetical protein VJ553_05875 [Candidatus Paceibacterota bacterium]|nr:hypothetical protein [Candidatus Paceibacterota bacterium]